MIETTPSSQHSQAQVKAKVKVKAKARHHLVLGGARSGKSAYAEALALSLSDRPVYLATSREWDAGHRERIQAHRDRRDERWRTVEEPLDLLSALKQPQQQDADVVLVDCLSLWITNLMVDDRDVIDHTQALCDWLPHSAARVIFVSNEVGMGVHPETPLGNKFRDLAGLVNQRIAASVAEVDMIIAGRALSLPPPPPPSLPAYPHLSQKP